MNKDSSFEITEETPQSDSHNIGALLKKTRIKKQLSTESVAQSLKLNEEYIIALEEERYSDLPAAPYVRVYLKALATHLGLNAEPLLQSYALHEGAAFISTDRERRDTISINVQEEKPKKHTTYIILVVICIVALVVLINQTATSNGSIEIPKVEDSVTAIIGEVNEGDILPSEVILPIDEENTSALDSGSMDSILVDAVPGWEFSIVIVKDSSWFNLYKDGKKEQRGVFKAPFTYTIRPMDSINIKVGKIQNVKLYRSGKELSSSGINMLSLRITESTVSPMSSRMWEKSFGDSN